MNAVEIEEAVSALALSLARYSAKKVRDERILPMICSSTDALDMFYGSDLQVLVMEGVVVRKTGTNEA
jgi:predicted NodU family carbamoyl transferase